jgi:lysozyme
MFTPTERIAAANPDTVGQALAFEASKNYAMQSIHVADIATITAVDTDTNTLTVKPIATTALVDNQGNNQTVDQPTISDTPYIGSSPQQGGYCLLIYCDHDISAILNLGGLTGSGTPQSQNVQIQQSHSLNHAVAILFPSAPASNIVSPANYSEITRTGVNASLGVSNALLSFIESWEGFEANWYDDGFGNQTIGYGHTGTLPSSFTPPLTGGEGGTGEQLLICDLASYVSSVQSIFIDFTLKQNQFDALVDFCYNLGAGNLSGSTLKTDMLKGADSTTLKSDFDAYANANGELVSGLLRRRDAEWGMYCNGTYSGNG